LDAINLVRARAYSNGTYPKITTLNQAQLRKEVRYERRVEFPREGLRWFDLVRYRLAEKSLSGNIYGMLDVVANASTSVPPTGPLMDVIVNPGLWFWGLTPTIGDDGLPNLDNLYNAGFSRVLATMKFDKKAYLLPIPNAERDIMPQLTQNPGY
jgi:starch-binding outer membrane protein, SusD/RagB family